MDSKDVHDDYFISILELFFCFRLVLETKICIAMQFHFSIFRMNFYFKNRFGIEMKNKNFPLLYF